MPDRKQADVLENLRSCYDDVQGGYLLGYPRLAGLGASPRNSQQVGGYACHFS